MSKLTILTRAKNIYQTEGLAELLARTLQFLLWSVFFYRVLYLGEIRVNNIDGLSESDFRPKIENFCFRVVNSNKDADNLEAAGFEFRSHVAGARERLDKEAIAFCIFVDKEFACVIWMAPTEETRKSLKITPRDVEFCNHETVFSAVETVPKYRRMGLFTYCLFRALQVLRKNGWTVVRFTVQKGNIASQLAFAKFGSKLYGKVIYIKILRWRFWKEKRLKSTEAFPPIQ